MSGLLIRVGLGMAVALAAFVWHQMDRRAAYADGQRNERVIWQERQARAESAAEADRRKTQAEISRIETDYWQRASEAGVRTAELRKELDHEKAAGRACAAVTLELRNKLNAVGRRT